MNTVIVKDRTRISRRELAALARGDSLPGGQEARQFQLYRGLLAAEPQALIRYRREAFEGTGGPNRLRITFDRDLSCRRCRTWQVDVEAGPWRRVLADEVVLEIKFDGCFPAWVHDLVRRFQLQARSVSKYCLGLHTSQPAAAGFLARQEAC